MLVNGVVGEVYEVLILEGGTELRQLHLHNVLWGHDQYFRSIEAA